MTMNWLTKSLDICMSSGGAYLDNGNPISPFPSLEAALLGPPTVSLIYSVVVAWFLPFFKECDYGDLLPSVVPRMTLCAAALAVNMVVTKRQQQNLGTATSCSVINGTLCVVSTILSGWLAVQTRREEVEGGPPPAAPEANQVSKVFLVTGANTGIGKETCQQLLEQQRHATVIMACRSLARAEQARESILDQLNNGSTGNILPIVNIDQLPIVELDLSSLDSVRNAAQQLTTQYRIDVLILNAGLMRGTMATTGDGMEMVMQCNHVGHYLLTRLLLDSDNRKDNATTSTARVVVLTSSTYKYAKCMDVEDMFCTSRAYSLFGQYAQSKLANILFVQELRRRYCRDKSKSTDKLSIAVAVHPGLVRTDVTRYMPWHLRYPNQLFGMFLALLQKTPRQGAWGSVHAATSNEMLPSSDVIIDDRVYWVNRKPQKLQSCARDMDQARRLWIKTAELVGLPAN